jgi:catechol 2,3-dioxygenase-like lactoylglutathione lyase family enzyme
MYKALFLSPMIPSFNIEETADFFKNILGFSPVMHTERYAVYQKNNLTIHILPAGKDIGQMEFYMEVDNIDGLWTTIKDKVKGLKIKEPFDRDYGMREMHIIIPQTNALLFVGQVIKPK